MEDKKRRDSIESRLFRPFFRLTQREKVKLTRRLSIFVFFVLVSVLLWFINALGKDYNTELSYPVRYVNMPRNKILVNNPPDQLIITVNGYGYTLLRYKLGARELPLVFNVNSFALNRVDTGQGDYFFILSDFAKGRLESQLPGEFEILDIQPDSLVFHLTDISRKMVPVRSLVEIELEKQFMLRGKPKIEPDSIQVGGPQNIIDTLNAVYTEEIKIRSLDKSTSLTVELKPVPKVQFGVPGVNLSLQVEKYTESGFKVPLETINVPDSLVMKTFPSAVDVSFYVGLDNYESVQPGLFHAYVDYKNIEDLTENRIPVVLDRVPEAVSNVKYGPREVEFIIEKK